MMANRDGGFRKPFALSGYAVAPALRVPKARSVRLRERGERKESGSGRGEALNPLGERSALHG